MKKLTIGILAHVDAGKTTLAEGILYLTGSIRKLGRVDHKDAFLDTYELERARGITIFSKQAVFSVNRMEVTMLDTPGHVDFSAEMERTLRVLDYAILVISGSDGVQGHTETLWRLLSRYQIPTFLFVNKMDLEGTDRGRLMSELKNKLNEACIDFSEDQNREDWMENLAMCDEALLEQYMESHIIEAKDVAPLIAERKVFPCYFGSALKLFGVEDFLNGLEHYTKAKVYPKQFGAKVYKIARDEQGNRLTYMKITGGSLKVKMLLSNHKDNKTEKDEEYWEEKVNQLRIYSGTRFDAVEEVEAGGICAVTGLTRTYPGEGLGIEELSDLPIIEPVLTYQILLPPECDAHLMLNKLRQLEEEDPLLHIVWSNQLKELHVQLMGEVQIDILKNLILQRFGVSVAFGPGNIVYKETILEPVEGVGHFEPLRHYAEVHLLLEPGEPGSGLGFASVCSEDDLDRNWQRLILTHLEEKEHLGVLTGSPITDMSITLIAGRAHQKHTEGGDFRQATYRAVRQGLKKAKSVLLEPYYDFRLEIPTETIGRAMSDIQRMNGSFHPPQMQEEMSVLTGSAPVATMRDYQTEVIDYSRGRGRLVCTLKGYEPCHNAEEIIEAMDYDSERDLENPTGSVFCAHGAGFVVDWDRVESYMHIDTGWQQSEQEAKEEVRERIDAGNRIEPINPSESKEWKERNDLKVSIEAKDPKEPEEGKGKSASATSRKQYETLVQQDKELEAIFVRTYGPMKQSLKHSSNALGYEKKTATNPALQKQPSWEKKAPVKEYLLVDGYNIIFSWEELNSLAQENMDAARRKLMDILCNYQGYRKCILILVFDAYKVKGNVGELLDYHNIHVVYTKEAETADQYIEKVTHEIAKENHVTVATSDAMEQLIILGKGAIRMSANELKGEILRVGEEIRRNYLETQPRGRAYLKEQFDDSILELLKESPKKQPDRKE